MHTVAKMCLTENWRADRATGTKVPVNAPGEHIRVVVFSEEMVEKVQGYVDTIRFIAGKHLLLVEHRVDFSNWIGVPGQFGTADAIILIPIDGEPGNYELFAIDLKTGWVRVDPEENSQGMIYALGALNLFELSHNITRIRIGIYQPAHGGLREWSCSIEHLMEFAKKVKSAAAKAEFAASQYGAIADEAWNGMFLHPNPNEEDCRFCRALPTCPAAARQVEDTTGASFAMMAETFDVVPLPDDLSAAMKACGFLEDFVKSVRAEVERRLMAGETVDGFGLELGREGARKWNDETAVEELMRKRFRLNIETTFDLKLKSPTTIEKLAKAKDGEKPLLSSRQWQTLQPLISRSPASPSVKPVALIKTPYAMPKPDAGTFDVVNEAEDLS